MTGNVPSAVVRDVQTLFSVGAVGGLTDRQLLELFAAGDDAGAEAAFAILVQRHGRMVWGVCRRALDDPHAAADAFQATFLVLVRKAAAIRVDDSLGPWLYGVSRRVATRARANASRRWARETGGVEAVSRPSPDPGHAELLAILDNEIGRLPERYRSVIVLCDLEGLTHPQAAHQLGCPIGTVESRLSRGRQKLRDRLVRRGLAPATAALLAEMAREASAATPSALINQTARFVTSSPAAGAMPAAVVALAQGVIRMMWIAKLKPLAVVTASLILATSGVVAVQGRQKPAPEGATEQAKAARLPIAAVRPDLEANRAIARKQLALIDEIEAIARQLARNSRISLTDASYSLWGRRRLDALRMAGAGKAEIVAAMEKHIENLKQDEAMAEAQRQAARGTILGVREVQFRLMEAQIWLNDEKAR